MIRKFILVSLPLTILLSSGIANAQALKDITHLERQHQKCLDTGNDMMGCLSRHYHQMDSLLNVAYNNLRKQMAQPEKDKLKEEQLEWLKERDSYFSQQRKEYQAKAEEFGRDALLMVYDNNTEFVKKRVVYLINRRK